MREGAALLQMKGRLAWFSVGYAPGEFEQIQSSAAVPLKPGAKEPPIGSVATCNVINSG